MNCSFRIAQRTGGPSAANTLRSHPDHAGHHHRVAAVITMIAGRQRCHRARAGADEGAGLQHHAGAARWRVTSWCAPGAQTRQATDRRRRYRYRDSRCPEVQVAAPSVAHQRAGGGRQHQLEHLHPRGDQRRTWRHATGRWPAGRMFDAGELAGLAPRWPSDGPAPWRASCSATPDPVEQVDPGAATSR